MKIGFFLPSLYGGGAERVILLLAHKIALRGYQVDLVLANKSGPYLTNVHDPIRLVDLKASRPFTAIPSLVRYIRKERPNVILSTMFHANLAMLWAIWLSGVPVRSIVREANPLSFDLKISRNWTTFLMPWLLQKSYAMANHIIALSHGVADDLARTISLPRDKIKVIYNPVDYKVIHRLAKAPVNHPWLQVEGKRVVIAIGRFCEQKDFPTLIKAFALVSKEIDSRLIILGQGESQGQMVKLIESLGLSEKVSLPGFTSNPFAYMSKADVFVLSSRWEGLGNVLIEALVCGVPIIATDCPYGPSEILENGKFGRLVQVGDSKQMAIEILKVLRGNVLNVNFKKALAKFDEMSITNKYLELLIPGQCKQ